MAELSLNLTRAIFGIGNTNHQHVHRHNKLNMDGMSIDRLRLEVENGGILGSTLAQIAARSGEVIARPQGDVEVLGGFNLRRGIAMLQFLVQSNAMVEYHLTVLFYLYGGEISQVGISEDVLLVPVRCWSTEIKSTQDLAGFPITTQNIDSSHQFLLGDPNGNKSLKAVRPIDVGNEAMGYAIAENDGLGGYSGVAGSELTNNVMMSKTKNLTPSYYAQELLRLGVRAKVDSGSHTPLDMSLSDGIIRPSIGEIGVTENPFMMAMMSATGLFSLGGFRGYTVGEVLDVFTNMMEVTNLNMVDTNSFAADDTLLTSREYGSASPYETIATELAMTTMHCLLNTGLASMNFSASNNSSGFDTSDNDAGIVFMPGQAMSLLENDMFVANRVESFKNQLIQSFFAKYNGAYLHQRTLMNVAVSCYMFGETQIQISFQEDNGDVQMFTNASYLVNHTSTSIAGTEVGLNESRNFMNDLKAYFQ